MIDPCSTPQLILKKMVYSITMTDNQTISLDWSRNAWGSLGLSAYAAAPTTGPQKSGRGWMDG